MQPRVLITTQHGDLAATDRQLTLSHFSQNWLIYDQTIQYSKQALSSFNFFFSHNDYSRITASQCLVSANGEKGDKICLNSLFNLFKIQPVTTFEQQ